MVWSRFGYRTPSFNASTKRSRTKQLSFKKGVDSYSDNDDVDADALLYARDMRQVKIGQYKTRKGSERYTAPVGEAVDYQEVSTTDADAHVIDGSHQFAQKATIANNGGVTRVDVNIRTTQGSRGTVLVDVCSDSSGQPGAVLATSSLKPSEISDTFSYVSCYFMVAPQVSTSDVVWVVLRLQNDYDGEYELSTTTNSTDGAEYTTAGSWTTTTYSANVKLYVSPRTPVSGVYRAYRHNGLNKTFFTAGTDLYTVDDVTGAPTSVYSSLAGTHPTQFDMAQDTLYFVDGVNKPYKYDFSSNTVSSVTNAPAGAFLCIEHKGLMMYVNSDDRNQIFYSLFADYDNFKSTDFLTLGPPKSSGGIVALAKLNGVLYAFENRNKYVVYGDSNATWTIDEATDQRGTFSQRSVTSDENYIYHADQEGVHQFNGTESRNLAKNFLPEYQSLLNKGNIALDLKDNRLFIFVTPNGRAYNTECHVYNLLLDVYEGKDTNMYIGSTFGRYAHNDVFILGSNQVGALYYGEPAHNNYDNLGAPLEAEIRTAYSHWDSPSQKKRIPKWRPSFMPITGNYYVEAGYAYDNRSEATWKRISLGSDGLRYDSGLLYDSGLRYSDPERLVEPANMYMSGEFNRVQRRYKHHAAHEPFEFNGEALEIEEQRFN